MNLRRLAVTAFACLVGTGGARITAADFRLRRFRGDHRLRGITAVSPDTQCASTPPTLVVSAPLTVSRCPFQQDAPQRAATITGRARRASC